MSDEGLAGIGALMARMEMLAAAPPSRIAEAAEDAGVIPFPREFDCRLCGAHVIVDKRPDKRTVFCCERCEREYWRHYDRYQRKKDIAQGHVVLGWQMERSCE